MDKFDKLVKFDDFMKEQLKDPGFKEEYDALEPEFAVMQAILRARVQAD